MDQGHQVKSCLCIILAFIVSDIIWSTVHGSFHTRISVFTLVSFLFNYLRIISLIKAIWFTFFYINGGLLLTVIASVIKRKDKLCYKTIIDYCGIKYDVFIHYRIPILTSAIASVNIGILWWIGGYHVIPNNSVVNIYITSRTETVSRNKYIYTNMYIHSDTVSVVSVYTCIHERC